MGVKEQIILKWTLKLCMIIWIVSKLLRYGPVAVSCERSDQTSGAMKLWECVDKLSFCQVLSHHCSVKLL
jgi:hypothetical protein